MAGSDFYRQFKASHCTLLVVHVHVPAAQSLLARIKNCAGPRRKLPFWFATDYAGPGKERLGLSVEVVRSKRQKIGLTYRWFLVKSDPPPTLGQYSDFARCLSDTFSEAVEASVVAVLVYEGEHFASLFKPIQMEESFPIFDEIVGVTGVKKDPSGKPLYRMELSFGDKELSHSISFVHPFDPSEECIKQILEKARDISSLALVPK